MQPRPMDLLPEVKTALAAKDQSDIHHEEFGVTQE